MVLMMMMMMMRYFKNNSKKYRRVLLSINELRTQSLINSGDWMKVEGATARVFRGWMMDGNLMDISEHRHFPRRVLNVGTMVHVSGRECR